ncbi:MAG: hypothetical protein ACE5FM_04910, partial [Methyloligellaceae bacterium]
IAPWAGGFHDAPGVSNETNILMDPIATAAIPAAGLIGVLTTYFSVSAQARKAVREIVDAEINKHKLESSDERATLQNRITVLEGRLEHAANANDLALLVQRFENLEEHLDRRFDALSKKIDMAHGLS